MIKACFMVWIPENHFYEVIVNSLFLAASLLVSSSAMSNSYDLSTGTKISNFEHLKVALFEGKTIKSIHNYSKCTETDPETGETYPGANAVGGMVIDSFEYFGKGTSGYDIPYIAASTSKMVLIGDKFYQDYVKLRFFSDGKIQTVARFYDPKTHEVIPLHDYECKLNPGNNNEAISMTIMNL